MNTLSNVKSGVVGVIVLLALPALAHAATQSAFSQQTTVAAVVHKGDDVIVNTNDALLMVGSKVLARLPVGQKLPVTAIQDSWLGTSLEIGGKRLSGWVQSADVMLARTGSNDEAKLTDRPVKKQPQTSKPRLYTAFRPAISESDSQSVARNCITPAERSYGPGEWDYYWSGHHEPDPNIHTWEPWRHNY